MKNIKKPKLTLLLFSLVVLLWQGCTKEKELEGDQLPSQTNELAFIDLGDNGHVKFIELEPGEILVNSLLSSEELLPEKSDLNPLELYEYYKKDKAPKRLVEAFEIAKNSSELPVENDEELYGDLDDISTRMSGGQFSSKYCSGSWGYMYCKLYKSGTHRITRTSYSMYTVVHPYRGNVNHKLIYRSGGTWKTAADIDVMQNWVSSAYQYGTVRKRQMMVSKANGDGFHYAVRGN